MTPYVFLCNIYKIYLGFKKIVNCRMLFLRTFFFLNIVSIVCQCLAMAIAGENDSKAVGDGDTEYSWPYIKKLEKKDLLSYSKNLEPYWLEVGLLLGVRSTDLAAILFDKEGEGKNNDVRCLRMWNSWLAVHCKKEFSRLVLALYLPCGGNSPECAVQVLKSYDEHLDTAQALSILKNTAQKFAANFPKNQEQWKQLMEKDDWGYLYYRIFQSCIKDGKFSLEEQKIKRFFSYLNFTDFSCVKHFDGSMIPWLFDNLTRYSNDCGATFTFDNVVKALDALDALDALGGEDHPN